MKKRYYHWFVWIFALLGLAMSVASVPASPLQSSSISMISPSSCPTGGCAAGQRLNFRTSFDLLDYNPSTDTNIQVCLFTPENWAISDVDFDLIGKLTGVIYTTDTTQCGPSPTNYVLSKGISTSLLPTTLGMRWIFISGLEKRPVLVVRHWSGFLKKMRLDGLKLNNHSIFYQFPLLVIRFS